MLTENVFETEQEKRFRIEVKDGYISLYPPFDCVMADGGYNIGIDRLQTPEKILGWAQHLAGKGWLGENGVADFVCEAFSLLGIKPDHRL